MIRRIQSPLSLLPVLLLAAVGLAQNQPPSSRPAPQISGRFIATDGTRSLTLHYETKGHPRPFTGVLQSTCMLPGTSRPLDLKAIPLGTPMTVYYVRTKVGKESQNVILSMRFDNVPGGSTLPKGEIFPCFKPAAQSVR